MQGRFLCMMRCSHQNTIVAVRVMQSLYFNDDDNEEEIAASLGEANLVPVLYTTDCHQEKMRTGTEHLTNVRSSSYETRTS